MGRQRKAANIGQMRPNKAATAWASLTWEDVDRWAGSRGASRGRSYERQGRVRDLVLTEDGRLLATVLGGERYATTVSLTPGRDDSRKIESACTCPVGYDGCKHAVAAALAYLAVLAEEKEVPAASPDDPRWSRLSEKREDVVDYGQEPDAFDDDEGRADEDDEDTAEAGTPRAPMGRVDRGAKQRTRKEWDDKIGSHIRAKSREELAALVCTLVERFPELRSEFQERIALAEGDVDRLVRQAGRDLHSLTSEIGWRNHWNDEGHTPDYDRLKRKLERLVEAGHYDEVVNLGAELIRRGTHQIEQSHDEGETAMQIADCLPVVFGALARSSRPAPDKILFVIDACLEDEFDVIGGEGVAILDAGWPPADWSVVADRLTDRLRRMPRGQTADDFTRNYKRDRLSGWLLQALERAGRKDELLAVYEAEARATGSYQRIVDYLLAEGRLDEADRWAREGIEKTQEKYPGIVASLLKTLCEMARRRKDWGVVAAHAARDFFERPSAQGFRELLSAADKAKCGEQVRAAALEFLESGRSPIPTSSRSGKPRDKAADRAWPLPVPDYLAPPPESGATARSVRSLSGDTPRPHYDVLLEMAIADKKPDDVLRWFDQMRASERGAAGVRGAWEAYAYAPYSEKVAAAVASTHPQRALDIYRAGLDAHLKRAEMSAYETCAAYLGKMRPILKGLDRDDDWTSLLADIRQDYRNRPRFMEILDSLDGQTIVQTRRSRRGR